MQYLKNLFRLIARRGRQALPLLANRHTAIVALAFWLPIILFVGLADNVSEGDTLRYDEAVLQTINTTIASPGLDPYVVAFTNLGSATGVFVITAGVIAMLLVHGYRRWAAFVTATVGGATVMNALLKLLFARDRPSLFETIVSEASYSFPSGHAMISATMAFTAIVVAWRTRYRWLVVAAAVPYFLLMSFTRLYLGVHYPTDVIAGWCIAAAWVVVMYFTLKLNKRKRLSVTSDQESHRSMSQAGN